MRATVLWLFLPFLSIAQEAQAPFHSSAKSTATNLTVHTRVDQSIFHIGEVIPLELSYSSTSPNTYQLDMATYDRSGRLGEESFHVELSLAGMIHQLAAGVGIECSLAHLYLAQSRMNHAFL